MSFFDQSREEAERLRFFGKITASVTHEINNVFSVINENSGLLSDWLKGAEKGRPLDPEKVGRVSQAIRKHLVRGQEVIKRLNRFAHGVDEPQSEFDLGEAVENIVGLCERFAYRKKAGLETELPEKALSLETSPFLFQQTLFNSIMFMLESPEPVETVMVKAFGDKETARVTVRGRPWSGSEQAGPELDQAALIAAELGAVFEPRPGEGEICISLPRRTRGVG